MPNQSSSSSKLTYEERTILAVLLLTLVYPAGVVSVYMWDIGPTWLKLSLLLPFLLLLPFFIHLMLSAFKL